MTLADPSLSLLNMDQESSVDEIPQHKITDFRYYCTAVMVSYWPYKWS